MKYFKIFVVIALCVSLFVNFNLLSKLDNLENRVNSISSNQHQVINSVNSQTNDIRNIINDMKREQSWLSPISTTTKVTDIDQGKVLVSFEWQVKELKDNSKVVLNYKYSDEKEYISMDAVEKGNGLFEASIPIEVVLEPQWIINITGISKNIEGQKEAIIEESKRANQLDISYFVSVTHNDTVKSSDINISPIESLGVQYYGYLETYTDISQDNSFSVSILGFPSSSETSTVLKEVYLKKYKNGRLLDEEKLASNDINGDIPVREGALAFSTKPSDEKLDFSRLVIKVIYSDGTSFEEEIYSN